MIVPAIDKNKALVANYLAQGKVAVLPTETVYGLAADAANGKAIAEVFSLKERPKFNPLIAHVSSFLMANRYVQICSLSKRLMENFWPGPLTLVLPLKKNGIFVHPLVTSGLPSLAIRNPRGFFSDVIEILGRAVAAPSANKSGKISPTTAIAASDNLGKEIPYILDAGPCFVGIESTIIKVFDGKAYLLRSGGVPRSEIEDVIQSPVLSLDHTLAIEAPGMLKSHYAPEALLRLEATYVCAEEEGLLAFGSQKRAHNFEHAKLVLNLSAFGDTKEAAMHLFDYLQQFDAMNIQRVAVEPIPMHGLGEAINDRLMRAASPRSLDLALFR